MKKIEYQVQGSAADPYNITISKEGNKLQCICDCPAGTMSTHCKHWMGVFEGTKQKYINLPKEKILEIQSWLTGSDLEDILNEFIEIKNEEERVKREFSSRKKTVLKKLKIAMRDI